MEFQAIQKNMETDLERQNAYRKKKDDALFATANLLRKMDEKMEQERTARIEAQDKASKESKRNFVLGIIGTDHRCINLC